MMKRFLALGIGVAAAVMVLAGPAFAKGPGQEVFGQLLVAGPGLSTPIELKGVLGFGPYGEEMASPDADSRDFSALVLGSGLIPSDTGYYGLEPTGDLGPRYVVTVRLTKPDAAFVTQDFYPFADGGPVFFNPPGQTGLYGGRLLPAWWYPPASIVSLLTTRGLPVSAPAIRPPAAKKVPGPVLGAGTSRVWIALGVIGALTLLLVGGALAGRQRSVGAA
jgi:hypothetical protein